MLASVKTHLTEFNMMKTQERVGINFDREKMQRHLMEYEKKIIEEFNESNDVT